VRYFGQCEESEIFWDVGGKCDILVCWRKVCILCWEKSVIFCAVGGMWDILVCDRKVSICGGIKVRYFGRLDESEIFWWV